MNGTLIELADWLRQDRERLLKKKGKKASIVEHFDSAIKSARVNYRATEQALTTAIAVAQETGEIQWELFLRHARVEVWEGQKGISKIIAEAKELQVPAKDERTQSTPYRICAYHDIASCYGLMDPVGNYQEIIENSQTLLKQLPANHTCSICIQKDIAIAAAEVGNIAEAESRLTSCEQALGTNMKPEFSLWFGHACEVAGKWQEAKRHYKVARKGAAVYRAKTTFLLATLGVARGRTATNNLQGALQSLQEARQMFKHQEGITAVDRLLEVEGYVAEAFQHPQAAIAYLTSAAYQYFKRDYYRRSALVALKAADLAYFHQLPIPEKTLNTAAIAIGMMPDASPYLYERLTKLGGTATSIRDITRFLPSSDLDSDEEFSKNEQAALQEMLTVYLAHRHLHGISVMLYRIGKWHEYQKNFPTALTYLIWNAIIERILKFHMNERKETLLLVRKLQEEYAEETAAVFQTMMNEGVPALLQPVLYNLSAQQWQGLASMVQEEVATGDTIPT